MRCRLLPIALLAACARTSDVDDAANVPFPFTGDTYVIGAGDTAGWDTGGPSPDLPVAPTWEEHIGPMFAAQCVPCHDPGTSGGLSMRDPYARLVSPERSFGADMPYVTPGDVQRSYLWHKIVGTQLRIGGSGVRMPRGTLGMSVDERELIRRWIASGAR